MRPSKRLKTQQEAFEEERQMWERTGLANFNIESADVQVQVEEKVELADNAEVVESPVQGNLWKVIAKVGDLVQEGDILAIAEAMKMEVDIEAPESGKIKEVLCSEGENVKAGKALFIIERV